MKSLIQAVVIAAVLAAPVASFAQSNQPVTRAQVRAELIQLEKAGYQPGARRPVLPGRHSGRRSSRRSCRTAPRRQWKVVTVVW